MQTLISEYGRERAYSLADLERVADRLAGGGMRRFFQRHVRGSRPIPVEAYLARLGLEAHEQGRGRRARVVLRRREQVSAGQEALRRAMFSVD